MEPDPACPVTTRVASTSTGDPFQCQAASLEPVESSARELVLGAVMRGLFLDQPWRHAYLRNRWIGQ